MDHPKDHSLFGLGLPGNCLPWEVVGDYFPDLYYRDWPTTVSQPVPYLSLDMHICTS